MPLPLPNLDDRRWTDLVDEARSLLPLYAPAWTDWNVSDPGITLVELLAWQAEQDLYWLNRLPVERQRKFLARAGLAAHPPRAARTVVAFSSTTAATAATALPADLEVEGTDLGGVRTVFRTLQPLTVGAASLAALQVAPPAGDPSLAADFTARWRRGGAVALLGDDPRPGAALYLGFDRALPPGQPLSLYFSLGGPSATPGGGGAGTEREQLIAEARQAAEGCPPIGCACGRVGGAHPAHLSDGEDDPRLPPHPSVRLAWDVAVGPGLWRQLDAAVGEVDDDSRSLTLDGRVVLTPPAALATLAAIVPQRLGAVKDALYYLRCRFVAGAYDAAPWLASLAVHGVLAEQAEAPPVRLYPLQPTGAWIGTALGQGTGEPHQQLAFPAAPVLASTLELCSIEDGQPRRWSPRIDFDGSRRRDAHVVLDLQQGIATVGDGEAGRTVPDGAPLAARYRATRAGDGNLPAGRIAAISDTPHNRALSGLPGPAAFQALLAAVTASNPLPAAGGADAESEPAAAARAAAELRQSPRAIQLADYERLALAVPGTRVARATAVANFDPAFPCLDATGVVTVIVLPWLPLAQPQASPALLRRVSAWLRRRRLIGTRVVVTGPTYRQIAVDATVNALPHTDPAALTARVLAALDGFFHPLTGGLAGQGWPFGRAVYRAEVLQVLSEVAGVDSVASLALVADGTAVCGNVCLAATELVAAADHEIQVE